MEDLISSDDAVLDDIYEWWTPLRRRCPPMLVARLLADLGPYVVQRAARDGSPVLNWYHRQFGETARERYLSAASCARRVHWCIANYFTEQTPSDGNRCLRPQPLRCLAGEGSAGAGIVNVRRCSEVPFALLQTKEPKGLGRGVLEQCSFAFLMAKIEAGLLWELVADLGADLSGAVLLPTMLPLGSRTGFARIVRGLRLSPPAWLMAQVEAARSDEEVRKVSDAALAKLARDLCNLHLPAGAELSLHVATLNSTDSAALLRAAGFHPLHHRTRGPALAPPPPRPLLTSSA